jgi:hypothetical protein
MRRQVAPQARKCAGVTHTVAIKNKHVDSIEELLIRVRDPGRRSHQASGRYEMSKLVVAGSAAAAAAGEVDAPRGDAGRGNAQQGAQDHGGQPHDRSVGLVVRAGGFEYRTTTSVTLLAAGPFLSHTKQARSLKMREKGLVLHIYRFDL